MFSPSFLHELASGQRRRIGASLLRGVLAAMELPVAWYVRRKNRAFDEGRAKVHRVDAPVISVGNLTAGGTGKTPMVEWIARRLLDQGKHVVLISRGYGAARYRVNDEAMELSAKLPDVPHWQNADRVAAARLMVEQYPGSVLLLDDAFQHRRLHRDLDIVLLDALCPFGYERLIPRGFLREPVEGLKRAQAVVLSRANLVDEATRAAIRSRVAHIAPQATWSEAVHAPRELRSYSGEIRSLDWLRGKGIAAFCGLGNPAGFRRTLESLDAEIVAWREFEDHTPYNRGLIALLDRWSHECSADAVICTHKDLVKIPREALGGKPLLALVVGIQFTQGEARVSELIEGIGNTNLR
jgi:tetraacyldisaccharide 4'-kinase